jgi:hypothetical protein
MEAIYFFSGVLTTSLIFAILLKYNKLRRKKSGTIKQSILFWELKQFMPGLMNTFLNRPTQAQRYDDSKVFRYIEMPDNKAYWLYKNKFYYADIKSDGRFNRQEGKIIEMKNLSQKQVTKMLFIYNTLKNG